MDQAENTTQSLARMRLFQSQAACRTILGGVPGFPDDPVGATHA